MPPLSSSVPVLVPDGPDPRPLSQKSYILLGRTHLPPRALAFDGVETACQRSRPPRSGAVSTRLDAVHQVLHRADEGVFSTRGHAGGDEDQEGWSWSVMFTDGALYIGVVFGEEHFELDPPLQVEGHVILRAVDLEGVLVPAAAAKRVASNVPTAPLSKRARKAAASSKVTSSRATVATVGTSLQGRSFMTSR